MTPLQTESSLRLNSRLSPSLRNLVPPTGDFGGAPEPEESESISGILRIFYRRRRLMLTLVLGCFLLGVLACVIMTPEYASTATIELTPLSNSPVDSSASTPPDADMMKADLATDTKILQDETLAMDVIKSLHLTDQKPFQIKPGIIDRLRGSPLKREEGLPLDQAPHIRAALLKRFKKSLKVKPVPDTRLIEVTFLDPNRQTAANVANALVQAFISDTALRNGHSVTDASYWLSKQLDDLKTRFEDSQRKLADYERETGLGGIQFSSTNQADSSTGTPQAQNVILDRLNMLNEKLTAAESVRIESEAIDKLTRTQNPDLVAGLGLGALGLSTSDSEGNAALQSLVQMQQQEALLRAQYANLSVKYGENNPALKQIQSQLASLKQSSQQDMQVLSARAHNAYVLAKNDEDALRTQFNEQKAAADKLNDDSVQLQVLAQEALSNRTLYENLFSKLQEANIAAGVKASHINVVDAARPSALPAKPNIPLYLGGSLGVGIILAIAFASLRENLDNTVHSARLIEQRVPVRRLAEIPLFRTSPALSDGTSQGVRDLFSILRTSVLEETAHSKTQVLLITSAFSGEGKTNILWNLGLSFARKGERVLLIDGDLRKSDLHILCRCPNERGIRNLEDPGFKLQDAVVPLPEHERLFLLPAGVQPGWPDHLLTADAFTAFLKQARTEYDRILIDSPPMLLAADASLLAQQSDGLLLVIRLGFTTQPDLEQLLVRLQTTSKPVLGYVLNDADPGLYERLTRYNEDTNPGSGLRPESKEDARYAIS